MDSSFQVKEQKDSCIVGAEFVGDDYVNSMAADMYYRFCEFLLMLQNAYISCQNYIRSMVYAFDILSKNPNLVRRIGRYCLYPANLFVIGSGKQMISNWYSKVSIVFMDCILMTPEEYKLIDFTVKLGVIPSYDENNNVSKICRGFVEGKIENFTPVLMESIGAPDICKVRSVLGYNVLRDVIDVFVRYSDYYYSNCNELYSLLAHTLANSSRSKVEINASISSFEKGEKN